MDQNPSNTTILTSDTASTAYTNRSATSENTHVSKPNPTRSNSQKSIFIDDLLIYGLCLTLLCIICIGRANDSVYRFTNMLTKTFILSKTNDTAISFNDIVQSDGEDFWQVLQGPIFDTLYHTKSGHYGNINDENQILGVARLRQLRVKTNSCSLNEQFVKRGNSFECYASYSEDNEDHADRRDSPSPVFTPTAWTFMSKDKTKTNVHQGLLSTYAGGGYVQLFNRDATMTMKILQELKTNRWINRGTRAIFFDTIVYNPNINLFAQVRLLAEYSSSGGAIPSALIQAVELIQYTSAMDYFILVCEILFVPIVLMQVRQTILVLIIEKFRFILNLWNIIHLLSIVFACLAIIDEILVHVVTKNELEKRLKIEDDYPSFDDLFQLKINSDFYLGLTLAINWLKIFNYFHLNQTLLLLHRTMSICLKEIFAFALIFVIILLSYTQFGWLRFGVYRSDWRSFRVSILTLFRMIFGDFDLNALIEIDSIVGPFFFFTYIYLVYFVLLNMFLAIINAAYSKTVSDLSSLQTWKLKGFSRLFSLEKSNDDQSKEHDESAKILFNQNQKNLNDRLSSIEYSLHVSSKLSYDDYFLLSVELNQFEKRLKTSINELEHVLSSL